MSDAGSQGGDVASARSLTYHPAIARVLGSAFARIRPSAALTERLI